MLAECKDSRVLNDKLSLQTSTEITYLQVHCDLRKINVFQVWATIRFSGTYNWSIPNWNWLPCAPKLYRLIPLTSSPPFLNGSSSPVLAMHLSRRTVDWERRDRKLPPYGLDGRLAAILWFSLISAPWRFLQFWICFPKTRGIPEQTLHRSSLEESTYFLVTLTTSGTQVPTMILMETYILSLKKSSKLWSLRKLNLNLPSL